MKTVMERVQEHYDEALEYFPEDRIVGIFLQGSQNYGLEIPSSDVDTKLIVVPTFEEIAFSRCGHLRGIDIDSVLRRLRPERAGRAFRRFRIEISGREAFHDIHHRTGRKSNIFIKLRRDHHSSSEPSGV